MPAMEKLSRWQVHEATEVLVESFVDDPIWQFCYPNKMLRTATVYATFAANTHCLNLRTTYILKDDDGKIVSTVIFEDERLNPLIQLLGYIAQSQLILILFVKKLMLDGYAHSFPHAVGVVVLLPLLFVGYSFGSLFFGINLIRAYFKSYMLGRKDGWHEQKKKHLLAIGTLPTAQGNGHGSQLIKAVIAELEAEKYYGGYNLESSNPRNVTFYERNGFVNLGAVQLSGMTVTLLVRPDLHRPYTSTA